MTDKEKEIIKATEDTKGNDSEKISEATKKLEEAKAKPKKKLSKGLCFGIIAIIAVVSFIVGILVIDVPIKELFSKTTTFTVEEMSITLPKDFSNANSVSGFTACYASEEVSVFVIKDSFEENDNLRLYSLDNYRLNLLHENGLLYNDLKNTESNPYFIYDYVNPDTTVTYTYFTFTYETSEGFWIIQFATEKANATKYEAQIVEWANTIAFATPTETDQ